MVKLKPCPFCGGEAKLHDCMCLENETMAVRYEGKMGVHCTVCHIATMPMSEEEAIKAWNRRKEAEEPFDRKEFRQFLNDKAWEIDKWWERSETVNAERSEE